MIQSAAARLLANKHTSAAAAIYIAAKVFAKLGAVWLPQYKDQFEQTAAIIESASVSYGFIMAGDSKPSSPPQQQPPANS